MRLAVIGGSGFVGTHAIERAVARGHNAVSFDRIPAVNSPVESHVIDTLEAGNLRPALGGFDAVINTAALVDLHLGRPVALYEANVLGVKNVIKACRANDIPSLVHMSSAEVITGRTPLRGATELGSVYPTEQLSYYGETKKLGEKLVLDAADNSLGTCAMRTYGLFGPGDNTVVPMYLKRMPKHRGLYIGDLGAETDVVFGPNLAHALVLAAEQLTPLSTWSGAPLHVTDNDPVNIQVFLARLVSVLGYRVAEDRSIARRTAESIARVFELRYRMTKSERWARPRLTRHSLRLILDDYWLDSSRIRRELGYEPVVSRTEAVAATQVWLQQRYGRP